MKYMLNEFTVGVNFNTIVKDRESEQKAFTQIFIIFNPKFLYHLLNTEEFKENWNSDIEYDNKKDNEIIFDVPDEYNFTIEKFRVLGFYEDNYAFLLKVNDGTELEIIINDFMWTTVETLSVTHENIIKVFEELFGITEYYKIIKNYTLEESKLIINLCENQNFNNKHINYFIKRFETIIDADINSNGQIIFTLHIHEDVDIDDE